MTITKLALDDVQHSADLRAAMEALLADSPPQTFTLPAEVVPEPETVYHSDIVDTRDLVGAHFVGPMAGK